MNRGTHYKPTKNLHIPQLQDHATTLIQYQIIEIIFQYYKGTVTSEGDLNVPIVQRLDYILKLSYNQLRINSRKSVFVFNQRPGNQLNRRRGDKINVFLQLFTINVICHFPDKLGGHRYITSFAGALQDRFENFQKEIEQNLEELGYYSFNQHVPKCHALYEEYQSDIHISNLNKTYWTTIFPYPKSDET